MSHWVVFKGHPCGNVLSWRYGIIFNHRCFSINRSFSFFLHLAHFKHNEDYRHVFSIFLFSYDSLHIIFRGEWKTSKHRNSLSKIHVILWRKWFLNLSNGSSGVAFIKPFAPALKLFLTYPPTTTITTTTTAHNWTLVSMTVFLPPSLVLRPERFRQGGCLFPRRISVNRRDWEVVFCFGKEKHQTCKSTFTNKIQGCCVPGKNVYRKYRTRINRVKEKSSSYLGCSFTVSTSRTAYLSRSWLARKHDQSGAVSNSAFRKTDLWWNKPDLKCDKPQLLKKQNNPMLFNTRINLHAYEWLTLTANENHVLSSSRGWDCLL